MRARALLRIALAFAAAGAACTARGPAGPPPLVVGEDAPKLAGAPRGADPKAAVSNDPCFVCHANYRSELMASAHAAAGVGCVDCHGASFAHRNDENNTTPPETMYPPDGIDPACRVCHAEHEAPEAAVAAKRAALLETKRLDEIACTDCHGAHRLAVRTVRWDKRTGELITAGRDRS
ncbi:MAG: ammonia-forming cytochrome c nitrite reductase subunit c552 [Planctomycetes bacterium]|nr:ammonia-forming cytochrome c nitrite reductase subunit c552 [Planctomycetota bacterium]